MKRSSPVQLLVGFSDGSASNIIARTILPALSEALGQQVMIVQLPGENGALAAERLAAAAPDGQTLGIAVPTHVLGSLLAGRRRYDLMSDFAPVALFARNPLVLAVGGQLGASSVVDLLALAKSAPGELVYGASAIGGGPHLAPLLFCAMTGAAMQLRVYAETNLLYEDVMAGRIALTFNNTMSTLPLSRSGRLVMLAQTGLSRSRILPELPTIAETVAPGYEIESWVGLLAPAGTPFAIVNRINAAVARAIDTPEVRDQLHAQGVEPFSAGPDKFAAHLRAELDRWLPFVREHIGAFPGMQQRPAPGSQ